MLFYGSGRFYDSQHTDSKQTVSNGLHMILFTTRINFMKPIDYFDRLTLTDLRNINNAGTDTDRTDFMMASKLEVSPFFRLSCLPCYR